MCSRAKGRTMNAQTHYPPAAGAEHYFENPRHFCEEGIRAEEANLAGVHIRRASIALAATRERQKDFQPPSGGGWNLPLSG